MELSKETKAELLADCSVEELQEAINKRAEVKEIAIVVRDCDDCTTTVRFDKDKYGITFTLKGLDRPEWKWEQTSVQSLIDGLAANKHLFPERFY